MVISSTEIDLSWTPIAGASAYTVRRDGNPINTGAASVFNDTGLTPSTTYGYTVAAINTFGEGLPSAKVMATTPASGHQFKFPTGHWIFLDSGQSLDTQYAQLDTVGAKKQAGFNITGACVRMDWSSMEGNTQGDFMGGRAQWDRFIAKANTYGLKIGFHLNYQKYNKAQTTFPAYFPTYLGGAAFGSTHNDGTNYFFGGVWTCANSSSNGGFTQCAMLWNSVGGQFPVRDALVNVIKDYGARYDNNQTVQLFTALGEEPPAIAGYSDVNHLTICTGSKGVFPQGASAWPTTILRIMDNYGQNDTGLVNIMNAAIANNWACGGGPDTCNETGETCPSGVTGVAARNDRTFNADQLYRNVRPNGTGASYVGKYWWIAEIENPEQGNSGFTRPAQFGSGYNIDMLHHANLQGATLCLWAWNSFIGPNDNRTVTNPANTHPDLWDFLTANPLTNTSYPSNVP